MIKTGITNEFGRPTIIDSPLAMQELTSPPVAEPSQKDVLTDMINDLCKDLGIWDLKKASSRAEYAVHCNNLQSSKSISDGKLYNQVENPAQYQVKDAKGKLLIPITAEGFQRVMFNYLKEFQREAGLQLSKGYGAVGIPGEYFTGEWQAFFNQVKSWPLSTEADMFKVPATYSHFPNAFRVAFRFALADYFTINDLSSVVDIMPNGYLDPHGDLIGNAFVRFWTFTGFRYLTQRLSQVPILDGSNETLLDRTVVFFTSEFTRTLKWVWPAGQPPTTFGTDHGGRTFAVMAGGGTRGGTVIGKRTPVSGSTPTGQYAANTPPDGQYSALHFYPTLVEAMYPPGMNFKMLPQQVGPYKALFKLSKFY